MEQNIIPFVAKIRQQNTSYVVTIPRDVVEKCGLDVGDIPSFSVERDVMVADKETGNGYQGRQAKDLLLNTVNDHQELLIVGDGGKYFYVKKET